MLSRHQSVFKDELGTMQGVKAKLLVKPESKPKFSKPDLSRAYQQILLDEDSREYVTINTQKSLYRPTPLPFGVSSASAIFQSKIEQVL